MQYALEDIADIGLGASTHGRSVVGHGSHAVPIINIKDIRAGYIEKSGIESVNVADVEKAERYLTKNKDVIVTLRGTSFRAAFVSSLSQNTLISSNLAYIRLKPNNIISPAVLCAWLNSNEGRAQVELLQHGSGMLSISVKDLKRIPITVPDKRTQKLLEQLTETNNRYLRLSEEVVTRRQEIYEAAIAACFTKNKETKQ